MAVLIRIATANALEVVGPLGGITYSGTPEGFPVTRLWDRDIQRWMQDITTASRILTLHYATQLEGRNYNALMMDHRGGMTGKAYTLERSADGSSWTTVSSETVPIGVVVCEFAEVAASYWRVTFPANDTLGITELYLTNIYTINHWPDRGSSYIGEEDNVSTDENSYGSERNTEHGPVRRVRRYTFLSTTSAIADEVKSRISALGRIKPFWLRDHEGVWIWGNVVAPVLPQEVESFPGTVEKSFSIDFREAL